MTDIPWSLFIRYCQMIPFCRIFFDLRDKFVLIWMCIIWNYNKIKLFCKTLDLLNYFKVPWPGINLCVRMFVQEFIMIHNSSMVNFTNILWAAFASISLRHNISLNFSTEKLLVWLWPTQKYWWNWLLEGLNDVNLIFYNCIVNFYYFKHA